MYDKVKFQAWVIESISKTEIVDGDYKHGQGKIEINGFIFEKVIVANAAGQATFKLNGLFQKFSACIGISQLDNDLRCGVSVGDARFRIRGDGEVLQDWIVKSYPETPTCLEVYPHHTFYLQRNNKKYQVRFCSNSTQMKEFAKTRMDADSEGATI